VRRVLLAERAGPLWRRISNGIRFIEPVRELGEPVADAGIGVSSKASATICPGSEVALGLGDVLALLGGVRSASALPDDADRPSVYPP
jgi:hypothetical protein